MPTPSRRGEKRSSGRSRPSLPRSGSRCAQATRRTAAQYAEGIPDRAPDTDMRSPIRFDLASEGYRDVIVEPRIGYVSWRMLDAQTGKCIECAALKTLLHRLADRLPRTLGARAAI